MRDYGKLVYLDVEKTGSTYVSAFLRDCCRLPLRYSSYHVGVKSRAQPNGAPAYRPGAYYFNSVRHPLSSYVSLYNYGCDRRGALRGALVRAGRAGLYDGRADSFHTWLDFLLDPQNARLLEKGYDKLAGLDIGIMTFRFLRLSLVNPIRTLASAGDRDGLDRVYASQNICRRTLRNETLAQDLRQMVEADLTEFFDMDRVEAFLQGARVNPSKSRAATSDHLRSYPGLARLVARESFLIGRFYPDML